MTAPSTCAVLVAAGDSTRMGSGERKPLRELHGRTILEHAAAAFDAVAAVEAIVVVGHADDRDRLEQLRAGSPALAKVTAVVAGGATRADSVRAGVDAAPRHCALIAVHDAARALVEPETIERALETASDEGAALVAIPVRDTLKRAERDEAYETVDRTGLWAAQTPQVFSAAEFRSLVKRAAEEEFTPTDDSALWERWVGGVAIVRGLETNLKITTEVDLAVAEAILGRRAGATP